MAEAAGVRVEASPVEGRQEALTVAAPPQLWDPLLDLLRDSGLRRL